MFTLASPSFYNPPYLELLFVTCAFMFMQVAVRVGATRAGACFIAYGLTVLLYFVIFQVMPYGHYKWNYHVYLFYQYFVSQYFGPFYPAENNVALKLYVIYPWLLLLGTMWLIPREAKHAVDDEPQVYCTGCSHKLAAVTTLRCPECDRAFNPQDPSTTSNDVTRNTRTIGLLKDYRILHWSIFGLMAMVVVAMILWMPGLPLLVTAVLLATLVGLALPLLWVQTDLAFKVFGKRYAVGYLAVTVILSYAFFLGIVLVPFLVMYDVKRKWRA